jgi:YgiT-type zinc finger domain-containing protein
MNYNCVKCKRGKTKNGTTIMTLEHEVLTCIVLDVPAQVCRKCGATFILQPDVEAAVNLANEYAPIGLYSGIKEHEAIVTSRVIYIRKPRAEG